MNCRPCGKVFTHGPSFSPGTRRTVCSACSPFQWAQCGTTQKQSWVGVSGDELCFPCGDTRVMGEPRTLGEPGDGNLSRRTHEPDQRDRTLRLQP
jgi:hypothetical protein